MASKGDKKLPGGVKFTPEMTSDQRLEHIEERKLAIKNKKTRRQTLDEWGKHADGDGKQFMEQMRDVFIEFHLAKAKADKRKFKVSTEFKTMLDVPNPDVDDLRMQLEKVQEKCDELDTRCTETRKNIAELCQCDVAELSGPVGDAIRTQMAKGAPRVNKGPSYVPPHLLAKGWSVMYTKGEGTPYYVHIMRQESQWDPPDKATQGDPPTPPATPDLPTEPIDEGWKFRAKAKDPWEELVETLWSKARGGLESGVPSRAQRMKHVLGRLRDEELQGKATSDIYKSKRKHRHENPNWDPDAPEPEPEQKEEEDGEGDDAKEGEGDEGDAEESESESEQLWKLDDQGGENEFKGMKVTDIFGDDYANQHLPRKFQGKHARIKFEFPKGCTPVPDAPEEGEGDEDGGGDGEGGDFGGSDSDGDFD